SEHASKGSTYRQHQDQKNRGEPSQTLNIECLLRLAFRQRLAVNQSQNPSGASIDTIKEFPVPKLRNDHLIDDPPCGGVIDHTLKAITDLDPNRAIVFGNNEHHAIVNFRAADF